MKLIRFPVSPANGSSEQNEISVWINPSRIIAVQTPEEKQMSVFTGSAKFSNTSRHSMTIVYIDSINSYPMFVLLPIDKVLKLIEDAN